MLSSLQTGSILLTSCGFFKTNLECVADVHNYSTASLQMILGSWSLQPLCYTLEAQSRVPIPVALVTCLLALAHSLSQQGTPVLRGEVCCCMAHVSKTQGTGSHLIFSRAHLPAAQQVLQVGVFQPLHPCP